MADSRPTSPGRVSTSSRPSPTALARARVSSRAGSATSSARCSREGSTDTFDVDAAAESAPVGRKASIGSNRSGGSPKGPRRMRRNSSLFLEIPSRITNFSNAGAEKVVRAATYLRRASISGDDDSPTKRRSRSLGLDAFRVATKDSRDSAASRSSSLATSSTGLPEDQAMRAIQEKHGRRLSIGASEGIALDALESVPWDEIPRLPSRREAIIYYDAEAPRDDAATTVTFFDWDDTLLPTTAVASDRGWEGRPKDEEVEALTAHAKVVHECLLKAHAYGHVAIVTLGKRPWVQVTCERYLLGVDWKRVFQELGIIVIYAQEVLTKVQRNVALQEGGVNLWIASKTEAMAKAFRKFKIKPTGPLNVVGIGDSLIEVEAAQEVVWRRFWRAGETCCCKTLRLRDEPATVQDLTAQLEEMLPWWDRLHSYPRDLRISVDDLSKDECPLRMAVLDPNALSGSSDGEPEAESKRPVAPRRCALCSLCSSWCSLGRSPKQQQQPEKGVDSV